MQPPARGSSADPSSAHTWDDLGYSVSWLCPHVLRAGNFLVLSLKLHFLPKNHPGSKFQRALLCSDPRLCSEVLQTKIPPLSPDTGGELQTGFEPLSPSLLSFILQHIFSYLFPAFLLSPTTQLFLLSSFFLTFTYRTTLTLFLHFYSCPSLPSSLLS